MIVAAHANGGYFISRLRDDVNPLIVAENQRWRGASRKLAGHRLRDVKLGLAREVVDVLVERSPAHEITSSATREPFGLPVSWMS